MTLEDILIKIDKILNENQQDIDHPVISALKNRNEINNIIQSAAPFFSSENHKENLN